LIGTRSIYSFSRASPRENKERIHDRWRSTKNKIDSPCYRLNFATLFSILALFQKGFESLVCFFLSKGKKKKNGRRRQRILIVQIRAKYV
jgi:hypothetical protein